MIGAAIFDLDGTLYVGGTAVPGAVKKLEELRSKGIKVLFLTNSASRNREGVALKLSGMGYEAHKEEVYCGSYLLARHIADKHPGKKVFAVGDKGVSDELQEAGVEIVEEGADIVAAGLDHSFTYEKLSRALKELRKGAAFIASNMDPTYPTEKGDMPGAGAIVTSIECASGIKPHVVGKPNCYALDLIKKNCNLSNDEIMMVGDRLDTDIEFARNCGIKSALVLSGDCKKSDIKGIVPDYVFQSVAELTLPSGP